MPRVKHRRVSVCAAHGSLCALGGGSDYRSAPCGPPDPPELAADLAELSGLIAQARSQHRARHTAEELAAEDAAAAARHAAVEAEVRTRLPKPTTPAKKCALADELLIAQIRAAKVGSGH